MVKLKRTLLYFAFFIFSTGVYAQAKPEMADAMRSNGKIYVVVVVCLIILTGLFLYVWGIDRKIKRLENGVNNH
ncbi:MAG: CcmD family protein [Ferruginibacter sp.]